MVALSKAYGLVPVFLASTQQMSMVNSLRSMSGSESSISLSDGEGSVDGSTTGSEGSEDEIGKFGGDEPAVTKEDEALYNGKLINAMKTKFVKKLREERYGAEVPPFADTTFPETAEQINADVYVSLGQALVQAVAEPLNEAVPKYMIEAIMKRPNPKKPVLAMGSGGSTGWNYIELCDKLQQFFKKGSSDLENMKKKVHNFDEELWRKKYDELCEDTQVEIVSSGARKTVRTNKTSINESSWPSPSSGFVDHRQDFRTECGMILTTAVKEMNAQGYWYVGTDTVTPADVSDSRETEKEIRKLCPEMMVDGVDCEEKIALYKQRSANIELPFHRFKNENTNDEVYWYGCPQRKLEEVDDAKIHGVFADMNSAGGADPYFWNLMALDKNAATSAENFLEVMAAVAGFRHILNERRAQPQDVRNVAFFTSIKHQGFRGAIAGRINTDFKNFMDKKSFDKFYNGAYWDKKTEKKIENGVERAERNLSSYICLLNATGGGAKFANAACGEQYKAQFDRREKSAMMVQLDYERVAEYIPKSVSLMSIFVNGFDVLSHFQDANEKLRFDEVFVAPATVIKQLKEGSDGLSRKTYIDAEGAEQELALENEKAFEEVLSKKTAGDLATWKFGGVFNAYDTKARVDKFFRNPSSKDQKSVEKILGGWSKYHSHGAITLPSDHVEGINMTHTRGVPMPWPTGGMGSNGFSQDPLEALQASVTAANNSDDLRERARKYLVSYGDVLVTYTHAVAAEKPKESEQSLLAACLGCVGFLGRTEKPKFPNQAIFPATKQLSPKKLSYAEGRSVRTLRLRY